MTIFFVCIATASNLNTSSKPINSKQSDEISRIKKTKNLVEQSEIYRSLMDRVGPEEAQEMLYKSELPFDGQTHLLNHTVGDYLYEKYGPAGLSKCRDYFLSSCYHGFLLHAIAHDGMTEVSKAFESCLEKGPTVSVQCAHAIGHGFLANGGYKNLTQALKTCDEAAKNMKRFPVYNCYDGVFMENIWAVHEGEPSPDRWIKPDDLFYPCDDPRIDQKYILACWSNQPSLAYQLSKGDFKKVAEEVCLNIKNKEFQDMCFDGLARQIHPSTGGTSEGTFRLCSLMPSSKWVNFCISVNAGSSYSVGDRSLPFEICNNARPDGKNECYGHLIGVVKAYSKEGDDFKKLCSKISDSSWRKECEKNGLTTR